MNDRSTPSTSDDDRLVESVHDNIVARGEMPYQGRVEQCVLAALVKGRDDNGQPIDRLVAFYPGGTVTTGSRARLLGSAFDRDTLRAALDYHDSRGDLCA